MTRVSIAEAVEPVEVDLWADDGGALFTVKPATRSVLKKADEVMEKLDAIKDDEQAVGMLAEMLDLRLVPANGKRTKASTIVTRKWEADELTLPQLIRFGERLSEAERPT